MEVIQRSVASKAVRLKYIFTLLSSLQFEYENYHTIMHMRCS